MEHSSDLDSQWVRHYEDAERRRRGGYEDPFTQHMRRLHKRERFVAVGLGFVQLLILGVAYTVLTQVGR